MVSEPLKTVALAFHWRRPLAVSAWLFQGSSIILRK
jgi:hypothetical protein